MPTLYPHEIDQLPNGKLVHTLLSEALNEQEENLTFDYEEQIEELERDMGHYSDQLDGIKDEIEAITNRFPRGDYDDLDYTKKPEELAELLADEIKTILDDLKTIQAGY